MRPHTSCTVLLRILADLALKAPKVGRGIPTPLYLGMCLLPRQHCLFSKLQLKRNMAQSAQYGALGQTAIKLYNSKTFQLLSSRLQHVIETVTAV